jgi:hypothetical protein
MNDSQWDAKLKSFLKKTGDDFKRFGAEVKDEAQKLLTEVQDPVRQQKLRDGLKDVGAWAAKTAEEVAVLVESGVKKTEEVLEKAGHKVNDFVVKPTDAAAPPRAKAAPAAAASPAPAPAPAPAAPGKKTMGKSATKKRASTERPAAKKTLGKKKHPGTARP